jgi:hypothetical protein
MEMLRFLSFYLTWGISASARVDVAVNPFDNRALAKLRGWIGLVSQDPENISEQVKPGKRCNPLATSATAL